MFSNFSLVKTRSLRTPLVLLARSYNKNSSAVNGAARKPASSKPQQNAQAAPNVANDLGGLPSHPERSFMFGVKDELRVIKEDVIQEDARRIAAMAKETSENISRKLGSVTGTATGKVMGAVKAASSKAAASVQDYEAKGKASLNDVLDAAEDKFGSFREPRAKQPINPKIDVLAEEDINDLIDELEDKVRGMDHVKEVISDPKVRQALGIDADKESGKRL